MKQIRFTRLVMFLVGALLLFGVCAEAFAADGGTVKQNRKGRKAANGIVVWQSFGSFPEMTCPAQSGQTRLTTGIESPNMWVEPKLVDTVWPEENPFALENPNPAESYYAPLVFDVQEATESGWYTYHVYEPYDGGEHIDSLYVVFDDNGDDNPPVDPDEIKPGRIVNLVVLDGHGYTRFRILNMYDYTKVDVVLYDRVGRPIFERKDYQNDFDFEKENLGPDTYYYTVTLYAGRLKQIQRGFVEVVKRKN